MGFLDHSTNNIIVDAVLTDLGRQALARNDGSFSVFQFSLGDDEVDYNIIKQFGRTVGKEKIEKNTPVLEALTHGNLALKYPLSSVSNEFLTHLPVLELQGTTSPVTFSRTSNVTTSNIDLKLSNKTGVTIENDILDSELIVEIPNTFLSINGASPEMVTPDGTAIYRISTAQGSTGEEITAKIPLRMKSVSTTTFNTSTVSGQSFVRGFVKVTGVNSGLSLTTEIQIS